MRRNQPKMLCCSGVRERPMDTLVLTFRISLVIRLSYIFYQRHNQMTLDINIRSHFIQGSWRSGLGFNALIHAHRPDLVSWSELQQNKNIDNLNYAFDVANSELGIPRLLDAEDVDTARPDEKSIITYVASYYHTFARMKNEIKSGKRIANVRKTSIYYISKRY